MALQVPRMHRWVVKHVFYLNKSTRSFFWQQLHSGGHSKAKKSTKGSKGGTKYKIAYCEAKQDFKVSKIHSGVAKLVRYLKEANRSIFLIAVRL